MVADPFMNVHSVRLGVLRNLSFLIFYLQAYKAIISSLFFFYISSDLDFFHFIVLP